MNEKLSDHFSLNEFVLSQTATRYGIDNTPTPDIVDHLRVTAAGMEQVRSLLGDLPIRVSSGYRSQRLNRLIGGSATSAHCEGWAVDFTCEAFGSPQSVARTIRDSDLKFDQIIFEGTWVHISFKPTMRQEVLTAHFKNGNATYTWGIA